MAEYGSGIYLDENFDWEVDTSGDVRGDTGVSELQKDLAFNVVRALAYGEGISTPENVADGGIIGEPLTRGILTDIEIAVGNVVSSDSRIDSVIYATAQKTSDADNYVEVECEAEIDVETETFEFVIPAS